MFKGTPGPQNLRNPVLGGSAIWCSRYFEINLVLAGSLSITFLAVFTDSGTSSNQALQLEWNIQIGCSAHRTLSLIFQSTTTHSVIQIRSNTTTHSSTDAIFVRLFLHQVVEPLGYVRPTQHWVI